MKTILLTFLLFLASVSTVFAQDLGWPRQITKHWQRLAKGWQQWQLEFDELDQRRTTQYFGLFVCVVVSAASFQFVGFLLPATPAKQQRNAEHAARSAKQAAG
jgi:hypothetical protein